MEVAGAALTGFAGWMPRRTRRIEAAFALGGPVPREFVRIDSISVNAETAPYKL
jgi:hypothetical protein